MDQLYKLFTFYIEQNQVSLKFATKITNFTEATFPPRHPEFNIKNNSALCKEIPFTHLSLRITTCTTYGQIMSFYYLNDIDVYSVESHIKCEIAWTQE